MKIKSENKTITMKNFTFSHRLFAVSAGLIILSQIIYCQEGKTKKFHNDYEVNRNSQLVLINKYGDIDIKDWNKDQISVDVTILVRDINEQKAEQVFEKVEISFTREENIIKVETIFDEEFFRLVNETNLQEKKFEINYLVMLPDYLKVDVNNKYGNIFVNRLASPSVIRVKYGSLKINELIAENKENMAEVDLGYSKGTIESCEWVKILAKYSQLTVQNSKALLSISKYSKISVEQGTTLICESKYDTYEFGSLSNFVTESQYSNIRGDVVKRKVELDTKYTDVKIEQIPDGFESVNVENKYGSVKIGIASGASYELEGHAKYARINYPETGKVSRYQENVEMTLEGIVGTRNDPSAKVKIETEYGGVSLY